MTKAAEDLKVGLNLLQVISGDDLELRAFACFVFAKCIIACSRQNRKAPPIQLATSIADIRVPSKCAMQRDVSSCKMLSPTFEQQNRTILLLRSTQQFRMLFTFRSSSITNCKKTRSAKQRFCDSETHARSTRGWKVFQSMQAGRKFGT